MFEKILALPVVDSLLWIVACACVYGVLQSLFPVDHDQPKFRSDTWVDLCYWLLVPVLLGSIGTSVALIGFYGIFAGDLDAAIKWSQTGAEWLRDWPIWAQAIGVLLLTDIIMYWTHRIFHSSALWRYHAIHHAPETLDWLHAARFHPINMVFHGILANSIALWVGFPPIAIAALGPFNTIYSTMVHANLNWTFGPLRHVFASPIFHRWHHTSADEGGSSNFAPTFSFLDHLFGTFYMPEGKLPLNLGLTERDMPVGLLGQLLYPFSGRRAAAKEPSLETTSAQ